MATGNTTAVQPARQTICYWVDARNIQQLFRSKLVEEALFYGIETTVQFDTEGVRIQLAGNNLRESMPALKPQSLWLENDLAIDRTGIGYVREYNFRAPRDDEQNYRELRNDAIGHLLFAAYQCADAVTITFLPLDNDQLRVVVLASESRADVLVQHSSNWIATEVTPPTLA